MIKLVHVITDTNIGGAGVWVLNFLKAFDRKKYDVCAALPKNSLLTPKIEELGIKAYEIEGIADKSFSKEGIKEFMELFKRIKPDIVHSHASISARIASKSLGIKTVNTRHCLEEKKKFPKNIVYSMVNNALSDIVIGVSEAACQNLIEDGTKRKKVKLVYNGVSPLKELTAEERLTVRQRLSIPRDNVVVGIAARLEEVKNHELFLNAGKILCERHDNITLLIAGEGSLEKKLKCLAEDLEIAHRTVFCGYQKDISEIMNIIDINTLTSKREALSLSLIEGMTLGIPAVATKSGGPAEVIRHGETGFIVNHNAEEFADAVSFYVNNVYERKTAGIKGKERSKELFGTEKMLASLDKIYEDLRKDSKNEDN